MMIYACTYILPLIRIIGFEYSMFLLFLFVFRFVTNCHLIGYITTNMPNVAERVITFTIELECTRQYWQYTQVCWFGWIWLVPIILVVSNERRSCSLSISSFKVNRKWIAFPSVPYNLLRYFPNVIQIYMYLYYVCVYVRSIVNNEDDDDDGIFVLFECVCMFHIYSYIAKWWRSRPVTGIIIICLPCLLNHLATQSENINVCIL